MNAFCSSQYWEARYRSGGTSGAGSYGRLAQFKADFINAFVNDHGIDSILDMGCGDGNLLSLLSVPQYVGVDVSLTALACCITRFRRHRFIPFDALTATPPAELTMSVDVIFHLVEDDVFVPYMRALFQHATRFVIVYSSNFECGLSAPHVRHRRFSDHVTATEPDWRLLAHIPNSFPYDPAKPDETSFADFFVYRRVN